MKGRAVNPTQVALSKKNSLPSWDTGFKSSGEFTDGAEWVCAIPRYTFDVDKYFKKYAGSITDGHAGFNCFHDDGLAAHYQSDGISYSELYCTHERWQSLAITSSKLTVKPEYTVNGLEAGKTPNIPTKSPKELARSYLQKVKDKLGDQLYSEDPAPLTVNCQAVLTCGGTEPRYLKKLADALIKMYDSEKQKEGEPSYSGYDSKKCFPQPCNCDPKRTGCMIRPDLCDHTKGVEMPKKFQASLISKVPPKADEDNGEISVPLASLVVNIECGAEKNNNDAMCRALKKLSTGLALFPPMATIFGAAALGMEVACG